VSVGHVMDQPNPNECLKLVKERLGIYLIPDYGPVNSVNRPVRTRTRGGVGAGGIKPPGYPIVPTKNKKTPMRRTEARI
jgi:hypothetical protein